MSNLFSCFSRRRSQCRWLYSFLSFLLGAGLFVSSPQLVQAIPWVDVIRQGVQIIELSNLSDREELQLGQQINQLLVSTEFQLYRNNRVNRYVEWVGERLAANSDRPNIPYKFQIIKSNEFNAFATAGGYVYVTTELLRTVENEAELAAVLGHEIGHITDRHSIKKMRKTALTEGIATAVGLDSNEAVEIIVDLALSLPYSRQAEYEADATGLALLRRAGYPEFAMVSFMEKLLKQDSSELAFLNTHPATKKRIARLINALAPQQASMGDGLDNASYRANIRPLLSY